MSEENPFGEIKKCFTELAKIILESYVSAERISQVEPICFHFKEEEGAVHASLITLKVFSEPYQSGEGAVEALGALIRHYTLGKVEIIPQYIKGEGAIVREEPKEDGKGRKNKPRLIATIPMDPRVLNRFEKAIDAALINKAEREIACAITRGQRLLERVRHPKGGEYANTIMGRFGITPEGRKYAQRVFDARGLDL